MDIGIGELCALGSAAAWAVGVVLYRRLGETLPPLRLNFLKNALVLLLLLASAPLVHGFALPAIGGGALMVTVVSGIVGISIADTLYLRALNQLGAGRMGIIGNLYSPFVIALSVVFLGERLGPLQVLGFLLVTAGVLLISTPADGWRATPARAAGGVLLGVLSIALMAVAIVLVKRVLEEQPLFWVSAVRMGSALVGLLLIGLWRGELAGFNPFRRGIRWPLLIGAAFIGHYTAILLWLAGYKYADASVAAVLNETSSVFILLLAWLWLREPVHRHSAAGVALTLAGVVCMLI